MPPLTKKRPGVLAIAILVLGATGFAAGLAELGLRLFPPSSRPLGQLSFATADGVPCTPSEAVQRGLIVPAPPPRPRPRTMLAPDLTFFICYTDNAVLRRDWLDAQGRVVNHINHAGIRERDEIRPDNKQPGERRIVCIGDSFTFGWGIPAEANWVRLLEHDLRQNDRDVRTVNCGASGTVCVDEYWSALRHRFHAFQPDAVILTLCLNDLIPSRGLNYFLPPQPTNSRLLDLLQGAFGRRPLDLDPDHDWVAELLALPKAAAEQQGLCQETEKPWEAMWAQGVPQQCMREAKTWCDARSIPFLVVIWPFLQGLGPGRHYPFQKLHDLVAADCAAAGIPFLDVLPALRNTRDEDLWVTPADQHPNVLAQRLALPAIAAFVRVHTKW